MNNVYANSLEKSKAYNQTRMLPKLKICEFGDFWVAVNLPNRKTHHLVKRILQGISVYQFQDFYYTSCDVLFMGDVENRVVQKVRLALEDLEFFGIDAIVLLQGIIPMDVIWKQYNSTPPEWFHSELKSMAKL